MTGLKAGTLIALALALLWVAVLVAQDIRLKRPIDRPPNPVIEVFPDIPKPPILPDGETAWWNEKHRDPFKRVR